MVEETNVQENDVKTGNASKPIVSGDGDTKGLFSVEILRLIRNAQKQHGLRHGDFQRYRGNCFTINFNFLQQK